MNILVAKIIFIVLAIFLVVMIFVTKDKKAKGKIAILGIALILGGVIYIIFEGGTIPSNDDSSNYPWFIYIPILVAITSNNQKTDMSKKKWWIALALGLTIFIVGLTVFLIIN